MPYKGQLRVFKPFSKLSIKKVIKFTIFDKLLLQIHVVPTFHLFLFKNTTQKLSRIKNIPKNLLEAKNFTQKIIFRAMKYPQNLTHPTP